MTESAIVFDLDGTLVDSVPDIHAAALKVLAAEGLPAITLETATGFVGSGVPKFVERMMQASGLQITPDAHRRLTKDFLTHYEAAPAELAALYPNVRNALDILALRGHKLGVCTNKPITPTRLVLQHFGIDDHFETIIGGDSLPVRKPDPAPLRAAFDGLGRETGIFVGDSEVDAETAHSAQIPFALFTLGYRKTPVDQLPHRWTFDDFAALPDLIS